MNESQRTITTISRQYINIGRVAQCNMCQQRNFKRMHVIVCKIGQSQEGGTITLNLCNSCSDVFK